MGNRKSIEVLFQDEKGKAEVMQVYELVHTLPLKSAISGRFDPLGRIGELKNWIKTPGSVGRDDIIIRVRNAGTGDDKKYFADIYVKG